MGEGERIARNTQKQANITLLRTNLLQPVHLAGLGPDVERTFVREEVHVLKYSCLCIYARFASSCTF